MWGERRDLHLVHSRRLLRPQPGAASTASTIGEADRRKYEADSGVQSATAQERENRGRPRPRPAGRERRRLDSPARQPQFVSSAYFLRFKFDAGTYALVGRETLDGRRTSCASSTTRRSCSTRRSRAAIGPSAPTSGAGPNRSSRCASEVQRAAEQGVARHALDRARRRIRSSNTPSTTSARLSALSYRPRCRSAGWPRSRTLRPR